MFLRNKKIFFLVGITLCVIVNVYSQIVTSTKNGIWTDPSLWDAGQVPTLANATEIIINHDVAIPDGSLISIQNVILNGSLTIGKTAVVDLIPDGLPLKWDLQIFGRLILQDGATLNGTSSSNTSFESGARYIHLQGPLGYIPYATWNTNSTFEIGGFRSQGYINIAHSDSWKQNFGHVVYNCTQQTTAFVDLNGYLRNIGGNFIVQSTNNQALRLSTTQNPVINIGEDFIIEGPSKVWFSTNPTNAIITVQQDFRYRSTSTGISYLTTKGVITVNVNGEMEMNSGGRLHMASTSLDSTGARLSTLSLRGDLTVTAGSIVGPPSPGKGRINFVGSGIQNVTTGGASTFQGTVDYLIESSSTLNMKNSVISNSSGALVVKGKLQLGSTDPGGAIQLTNAGNIQVQGQRTFEPGCTIEYNGLAGQWLGNGHPGATAVNLIFSNPSGTTLLNGIVANNITFTGKFNSQQFAITAHGHVAIAAAVEYTADRINLAGGQEQIISAAGATLKELVINKSANGVMLTSPLRISNAIRIESPNTILASNGNLSLLSSSDEIVGTARVGSLPPGSSITGNVTVYRYMSAEGRIYRYISSPVQNATIASLKDDFPITGTFQDPSSGPGIPSRRPSFFRYNESIGGLEQGWLPYPVSGLSSANPLNVGRGYCAYMWSDGFPLTWDVTGPLNHGDIELPVAFTANSQPSNGWNLVGNPYASAVQWNESVKHEWTTDNISAVIAIRDNGTGSFRYWDLDDVNVDVDEGQVATGQAFWVRATAPGPRLIIREGVKASGGAPFLRTEARQLQGLMVSIKKNELSDVAYYKIKPGSKSFLDDGDGLKFDNDFFDISFISSDHYSLAIHASDKFPCDTVIALGIKDLSPGNYRLSITPMQQFFRYKYTLLDNFTGSAWPLDHRDTVTISVNQDSRSSAFNRMSLSIQENNPDVELRVTGANTACIGSVTTVTIHNAEAYVSYSVWSGKKKLASIRAAWSGDLAVSFNTDSLALGTHSLSFQAQSPCYSATLQASHTLGIYATPQVLIVPDTACIGSPATLTAFSNQPDVTFNWFDEKDSNDTLFTGYSFETPPLTKTMIYYVSASGQSGCSSERFAARAMVKTYREAAIHLLNDSVLSSNYTMGNQWSLNGKVIENTWGKYLPLNDAGVYAVRVDTLGCLTQDTFTYIVSRPEPKQPPPFAYPNPASEFLYVKHGVGIQQVEIWDMSGKLVLIEYTSSNGSDIPIHIHKLARGIYTAVIFSRQKKWTFRFVKLTP